ncbi:MAG: class I tRNA ligase family protein, partial [Chitinivibrionales bacterium]|nr:class I tRNA ligase family protein [Chitinivibrionales bacterium]
MSKSAFLPVTPAVDFSAVEAEVLDFWNKERIFEKSLAATAGGRPFVFYDGPPFATGLPHYGHLLAGTIKDIVPRFRTMRGNYVARRFGWDCHGLPVENEMEKEFKVSGKRD